MVDEPLAKSGEVPVPLREHLQQVAEYTHMVIYAYREHWKLLLGEEIAEKICRALLLAALIHDLGKAADGFQRALREQGFRWEFRHEVLSASLLLSTMHDDEALEWAAIAVLTHHRDLNDPQLAQDCGLVALPLPDIVRQAQEKIRSRASELQRNWDWLRQFWQSHPVLCSLKFPETPDSIPLPASFLKRQKEVIEAQNSMTDPGLLALLLTRGWLMASDHAVSAGVVQFLSQLPVPRFPPLRPFQCKLSQHKGDAFLEAPTGSGKTVAAIAWALNNRRGGERIFYLLPYQASIEAMADTLEKFFGKENVAVLHARALDYAFREYFEETGEYESAAGRARAQTELNRLAHKPIKVATPFQILRYLFGIPRFEIGISEMVGGLFIFDEIHSYDAHVVGLIVEMVRFLKQLGGRFLFMSATFPPFLKELLQKALDEKGVTFGLDRGEGDEWTQQFLQRVRHILRWHDKSLAEMLPAILEAIQDGKRVLVVANRVAQAQEIYRQLREHFRGIHLLHSRFTHRDRVLKERAIIDTLHGKRNDVLFQALVATQVVEVSLDVSFDTIFTEIAPADDLLQRFGRVNRYGEHPEGVEVHVARQFDRDRVIYVYDEERLARTLAVAPKDGTPLTVEAAAEWVRQVYGDGWTSGERERYDQACRSFQYVLSMLKPLCRLSEGEEEFYRLFQTIQVLPIRLYDEYARHLEEKHYLLANQLLVPVPAGTFHMLKNAGLLKKQNSAFIADIIYDEELGLLSKEVDIDASLI
jgi:CRISPR-associated endonuclease/helicase Cas3